MQIAYCHRQGKIPRKHLPTNGLSRILRNCNVPLEDIKFSERACDYKFQFFIESWNTFVSSFEKTHN